MTLTKNDTPLPFHVQDFLDWLDVKKGLAAKSQENYSRFIKKFFDWLKINNLQGLKPHQLTSEHIWEYRLFLSRKCLTISGQPLKKSTQNYYLIALRMFLNYCADRDILTLPSEKVSLVRDKEERHVRFLVLEQLEKLFGAPNIATEQGLRDRAILEVFFSTGMRISELVSLDRDHLNIPKEASDFELTITGKGGRVRTVYFSSRALEWLGRYSAMRTDMEPALFINYRAPKHADRRLTPRAIEKLFKRYVMVAGLPLNTTPHVMRHSFATDLLRQGVDLRLIQEFLGHKHIAATQIYAHVTNKQLRDVHRRLHGGKKIRN